MRIIVASNIIFAAIRSTDSTVKDILVNPVYKFYAPKFLFVEIFKHKERILKKAKVSDQKLLEFLAEILHYINFINENIITTETYIKAHALCKNVDENDTAFIALALTLNCKIWTRDKKLQNGLVQKGFTEFIDESNL